MAATFKPRGKYVLVRPDNDQDKENEFGLITPSNVEQEKKSIGVVIEVGSEVTDIKQNDKVVFGTYAGETMMVTEEGKEVEYRMILEEDIIAFVY